MKIVSLFGIAGLLVVATISARGAEEEPVDIDAEVERLQGEYARVSLDEARCLEVARAGGTNRTLSSSGSYVDESASTFEEAIQEARQRLAKKPSIVVQAEIDTYEHNLKAEKARLRVLTQQSEGAWRNALPAANAAISLVPVR